MDLGHPWGNAPGAVANRVALEACVQARNEGKNCSCFNKTLDSHSSITRLPASHMEGSGPEEEEKEFS